MQLASREELMVELVRAGLLALADRLERHFVDEYFHLDVDGDNVLLQVVAIQSRFASLRRTNAHNLDPITEQYYHYWAMAMTTMASLIESAFLEQTRLLNTRLLSELTYLRVVFLPMFDAHQQRKS